MNFDDGIKLRRPYLSKAITSPGILTPPLAQKRPLQITICAPGLCPTIKQGAATPAAGHKAVQAVVSIHVNVAAVCPVEDALAVVVVGVAAARAAVVYLNAHPSFPGGQC